MDDPIIIIWHRRNLARVFSVGSMNCAPLYRKSSIFTQKHTLRAAETRERRLSRRPSRELVCLSGQTFSSKNAPKSLRWSRKLIARLSQPAALVVSRATPG
jgi:hypothetical protein